jgi:hypothetical protein
MEECKYVPSTSVPDWGIRLNLNAILTLLSTILRAMMVVIVSNCPQTFCYDAYNLLMVRFRATSQVDMKTCPDNVWKIPTVSSESGISIRYAFYLSSDVGWIPSSFWATAISIRRRQAREQGKWRHALPV